MARHDETIRMDAVTLGAVVGGVVAFIVVGAITAVMWVVVGVAVGGIVGYGLQRWGRRLRTYAEAGELRRNESRDELYREAQAAEIPGRSTMSRDELADAVARRRGGET
jgi:uncharacterized protein YcfJ